MSRPLLLAAVILGVTACADAAGGRGAAGSGGVGGAAGSGGAGGVAGSAGMGGGGVLPECGSLPGESPVETFFFVAAAVPRPTVHGEDLFLIEVDVAGAVLEVGDQAPPIAGLELQLGDLEAPGTHWARFEDDATGKTYVVGWSGGGDERLQVGDPIQVRGNTQEQFGFVGIVEVEVRGAEGRVLYYRGFGNSAASLSPPGGVRFRSGESWCLHGLGAINCEWAEAELLVSFPDGSFAQAAASFDAAGLRWATNPWVGANLDTGGCDYTGEFADVAAFPIPSR